MLMLESVHIGIGQHILKHSEKYEDLLNDYKKFTTFMSLPNFLQSFVRAILYFCTSETRLAKRLYACYPKEYHKVDDMHHRMKSIKKHFDDRWLELGLDALICPTQQHCAYKNENSEDLATVNYYYMYWNVLHYAAGTVPVTEVAADEAEGTYGEVSNKVEYKAPDLKDREE